MESNLTHEEVSRLSYLMHVYRMFGKHKSVRLPTMLWAISDLFGITDIKARKVVEEMVDRKFWELKSGGWLS